MSWAKLRMVRGMAERRALRRLDRRAADKISTNSAQEKPTADDASGCEGRAAEVLSGPAPVDGLVADPPMVAVKARQSRVPITARMKLPPAPPPLHPNMRHAVEYDARNRGAPSPFERGRKIIIDDAPSGMEAQAERWKGKGPVPMELAPVPVLCAGEVLCRCGSRGSGKGRGPVPYWFGDKCIEAKCELRGKA